MNCDACGRLIQEHPTVRYEDGRMNVFHSDPTCLRSKPRAKQNPRRRRSSEATLDFGAILGGGEKSEQEDG